MIIFVLMLYLVTIYDLVWVYILNKLLFVIMVYKMLIVVTTVVLVHVPVT